MKSQILLGLATALSAHAFSPVTLHVPRLPTHLYAADDEEKAAPLISGADLEMMLQDLEQPLVVDAYATWW